MARLYLDEMLGGFVDELRSLGHDVVAATEKGRDGRADAWHFREAMREGRILLTWDWGDFEYIHKLWITLHTLGIVPRVHGGILTAKGPARADWISIVHAKLEADDQLAGRMLSWITSRREWDEAKTRPELD